MTTRRLALSDLASVEWPTDSQRADFVEHLGWAHSWYKHLPFAGGSFVVFVLDDAGAGYEEHDRPHYGWKRTDEYRHRFGLLDYAWQLPGEPGWSRDAGGCDVEPSPELLAVAGFTLHPTCSSDVNAIEVVCSRYADERPADEGLRRLHALNDAAEAAYHALDRLDQESAAAASVRAAMGEPAQGEPSPSLRAYHELVARVDAHYASLRATEIATVTSAIDRLAAARSAITARSV